MQPYLSSFGRNRGRALSALQQQQMATLFPQIAIPLARLPADWEALRAGFSDVALEIGFGDGGHLLASAQHRPQQLFLGCEPYLPGLARCVSGVAHNDLRNVRLLDADARTLLEALPEGSLSEVFLLFADPWPKTRHHKRRLVNPQTLAMLARVIAPRGRLLIVTDHVDYTAWILAHLQHHPDFVWQAHTAADFLTPPADWSATKYQRKTTAQGRIPIFLDYRRAG